MDKPMITCTECGQEITEGQSYESKALTEIVKDEQYMRGGPYNRIVVGHDVRHLDCMLTIPMERAFSLKRIVQLCNQYLPHLIGAPDKHYRYDYQQRLWDDLSPLSEKHKQRIIDMIDEKIYKQQGHT
jgi:hypothetical protein